LFLPATAARRVSYSTCISIHVRGDGLKADVFLKTNEHFFLIGKIREEKKNQRQDTISSINLPTLRKPSIVIGIFRLNLTDGSLVLDNKCGWLFYYYFLDVIRFINFFKIILIKLIRKNTAQSDALWSPDPKPKPI
jgi:hypothetical protein